MDDLSFKYYMKVGGSRRKVEPIELNLGMPKCKGADNDWSVNCSISGFMSESKEIEGRSAFDCIVCGIAYLRQSLRFLKSINPRLKWFYDFEGILEEIEIEDIFMTHDCITDDIEEIID